MISGTQLGVPSAWGTKHHVGVRALDQVNAPVHGGLHLGVNAENSPVAIDLLGSNAPSVAILGGPWVGAWLAIRAIAAGAHVIVATDDPVPWFSTRDYFGVTYELAIHEPDAEISQVTVPDGPVVVVHAVSGGLNPGLATRVTGWPSIHVPIQADALGRACLDVSDLILLGPDAATGDDFGIVNFLAAGIHGSRWLSQLRLDQVLACSGPWSEIVNLAISDVEAVHYGLR